MLETILASFAVLIVFLFVWIVSHKKKEASEGKPVIYTCGECGEKDCNCCKEND